MGEGKWDVGWGGGIILGGREEIKIGLLNFVFLFIVGDLDSLMNMALWDCTNATCG